MFFLNSVRIVMQGKNTTVNQTKHGKNVLRFPLKNSLSCLESFFYLQVYFIAIFPKVCTRSQ